MSGVNDINSPSYSHENYRKMFDYWEPINALLGGTHAMRKHKHKFLPRHPAESEESYHIRLSTAVLYGKFKSVAYDLRDKPFANKIIQNIPENLSNIINEDIDLQGNDIFVFLRKWFFSSITKGFSHVLVENKLPQDITGTAFDDIRARPYVVHIPPENLIYMESDDYGKPIVIRFYENIQIKKSDFVSEKSFIIKEIVPRKTTVYVKDGGNRWSVSDSWDNGFDFIPLVTYYAGEKLEDLYCVPPLIDLAYQNILHFQKRSDQDNSVRVSKFPILACSGGTNKNAETVIGPEKILYISDPSGKFYYIEHSGKSIESGRQDLKDLEEMMQEYSAGLVTDTPKIKSATEAELKAMEATSRLGAMVRCFEDCVALMLSYFSILSGNGDDGGKVELLKTFGPIGLSAISANLLNNARNMGDISRNAYVVTLKQTGVLPPDYDPELDYENLKEEYLDPIPK